MIDGKHVTAIPRPIAEVTLGSGARGRLLYALCDEIIDAALDVKAKLLVDLAGAGAGAGDAKDPSESGNT
jgi:hypothetical protein